MKSPLALAFDCGTQSMRAMLFDKEGHTVGIAAEKYPPYMMNKFGYAEQHAEMFRDALYAVSLKLKEQCRDVWDNIAVVSLTTIRDTYLCVDAELRPLRPIIMWHDQREAVCADPMPAASVMAFKLVGMSDFADQQRRISKSNWIRENEPEIWKKTDKYLPISTYMTYLLTEKVVDSVASQAGHVPFDFKNRRWMEKSNIKFPVFCN